MAGAFRFDRLIEGMAADVPVLKATLLYCLTPGRSYFKPKPFKASKPLKSKASLKKQLSPPVPI
jgi:hypothetical protein